MGASQLTIWVEIYTPVEAVVALPHLAACLACLPTSSTLYPHENRILRHRRNQKNKISFLYFTSF